MTLVGAAALLAACRGLTYLLTAPSDLGLARAYVSGDLVVKGVHSGDAYEALKVLRKELKFKRPTPAQAVRIVRGLGLVPLQKLVATSGSNPLAAAGAAWGAGGPP